MISQKKSVNFTEPPMFLNLKEKTNILKKLSKADLKVFNSALDKIKLVLKNKIYAEFKITGISQINDELKIFVIASPEIAPEVFAIVNKYERLFQLTQKKKEQIIEQALETSAGRKKLAEAMIDPIRRSLEYQVVSNRIKQWLYDN